MLKAQDADDIRVRDIRQHLINTRGAYKDAERSRDNLLKIMYAEEESSIPYLARQFGLTEDKVRYILNDRKQPVVDGLAILGIDS